jgi:hypothetical protein
MEQSNAKGAALERAVHAIEEMVIKENPALARAPFVLEPNAIISVNGVRHEIDLLVRINGGTFYETMHLFECKNRAEPAGKNDVIILAAKVAALGAAKGTLVARAFTSDGEAQARQHPSIVLVPFTDEVWGPIGSMSFDVTSHEFTRFQTSVVRPNGAPESPPPDWQTVMCLFGNRHLSFTELCHQLANEWLKRSGVMRRLPRGEHRGSAQPAWKLGPGELIAGNWSIEHLRLDFDYLVKIRPTRLVSTFSVEKHGRFARYECEKDELGGPELAVEVLGHP